MAMTKESVKAKLDGYIEDYTRKIEMWKKVQLVTKKDGNPFQNLGKNFTNAKVVNEYGSLYLRVSDWDGGKYPHYLDDQFHLERYIKDWKGARPSDDRIYTKYGNAEAFILNPQEAFDEIQVIISKYEGYRAELEDQLTRLDAAFDYVEKTMAEVNTKLIELCGSDRASLYYSMEEKIRDFPYC